MQRKQRRDQLRSNREADLRLFFHICKMLVFSRRGSNVSSIVFFLRSVCFNIVPSEIKLSNLTVKNCSLRDNNKRTWLSITCSVSCNVCMVIGTIRRK